jgi:hypothetical protein
MGLPIAPEAHTPYAEIPGVLAGRKESRTARRTAILILAAVLGCALGYFLYLQVPPPVISVRIEPHGTGYVVSWPADKTRRAEQILMRINDGEPLPVPAQDVSTGTTQIPATTARVLKVEIIARNPLGNSRGIAELVR